MEGFHSTFSAVGYRTNFSPVAWAGSFAPAALPQWERDLCGVISFERPGERRRALVFEYSAGLVSVMHDDSRSLWASARQLPLQSKFVVADSGATIPAGSLVSLERAWLLVEQFLEDSLCCPAGQWADAGLLDWPEDF